MRRFVGFSELVAVRAGETPDRVCLRFFADGAVRNLSWAEFGERIATRAEELLQAGARCEAVLPDGSVASVVEVFAATAAGLQVALIDANYRDEQALSCARLCDADALWCAERRRPSLEAALRASAGAAGPDLSPSSDELPATAATDCGSVPASPNSAAAATVDGPVPGAVLFFTSGTTSVGKVVKLSDKSLMSSAFNGSSLLPLGPDDEVLCVLPLSHVFGFVCGVLWGMECDAPVSLGRGIRAFYQDLSLFDPTVCPLVPNLLSHALDAQAFGKRMRLVLTGASACPPELASRARERGIDVSAGYGLTETSSGVALSLGSDINAMTICPDCEIRISEDSEVLVKAPTCVMKGYYRNPETTARALPDDYLKTGDEGFIDVRGKLHVTGRLGDVLVLPNGEKVRVPDCERAIARNLHEPDCTLVKAGGKLVLVFGSVSPEVAALSKGDLLKQVTAALEGVARRGLIADVVRLGAPLPRTASGDVKRWQVLDEVQK